jgi:hypothetical protein
MRYGENYLHAKQYLRSRIGAVIWTKELLMGKCEAVNNASAPETGAEALRINAL